MSDAPFRTLFYPEGPGGVPMRYAAGTVVHYDAQAVHSAPGFCAAAGHRGAARCSFGAPELACVDLGGAHLPADPSGCPSASSECSLHGSCGAKHDMAATWADHGK